MRFISHLDTVRFMCRTIRRADIPVWYTEGFNPHLYTAFALPLSLGFESEYEVMDIRVSDDGLSPDELLQRLNAVCPPYVSFFKAAEPVLKAGDIALASFKITFDDGGEIKNGLNAFLNRDTVTVLKKTKKGVEKEIDIAPKIKSFLFEANGNDTVLKITLPAGSGENLNPELILNRFFEETERPYSYIIDRTALFDAAGRLFE